MNYCSKYKNSDKKVPDYKFSTQTWSGWRLSKLFLEYPPASPILNEILLLDYSFMFNLKMPSDLQVSE